MIFPAGKPRNAASNPLGETEGQHDPRSPFYQPELKKDVRLASKANKAAFAEIASKLAAVQKDDPQAYAAVRSAHSIGKANCGALTDIGGPVRQMKTHVSNSIWNPERLAQIKDEELTRGEQIKSDNEKLAAQKQQLRREVFTIDPEAIKAAMRSSSSAINTSAHATETSNYKAHVAAHQPRLFDVTNRLETMPELTPGEQIRVAAAERRQKKDTSWQTVQGTTNTKQKLSAFFESLQKIKKGK
jgi:hypothetical protein